MEYMIGNIKEVVSIIYTLIYILELNAFEIIELPIYYDLRRHIRHKIGNSTSMSSGIRLNVPRCIKKEEKDVLNYIRN